MRKREQRVIPLDNEVRIIVVADILSKTDLKLLNRIHKLSEVLMKELRYNLKEKVLR